MPEGPTEQISLFSIGKYSYQVIVTNMELKPINVRRIYNGRAGVQLIIKELKNDHPLVQIPKNTLQAMNRIFTFCCFRTIL
ncbi:TPA: hypothetical protein HA241_06495 [Candidatus Woesearchaeota archaeon]|nr:hypothetical protein [Candidatus Woesearchaeota archaeon]